MTMAYKCDGCGALFEKRFPRLNKYIELQDGRNVLVDLTIRSKNVDLCNDCLAKILATYQVLINNDLSPKKVGER